MAQLSSYRRIFEKDFPNEYQDLVKDLSITINTSFDELYTALNGRLTLSENFLSTLTSFNVSVDSSGIPQQQTQIRYNENLTTVNGLLVIKAVATNKDNLLPSGAVFVSYTQGTGIVTINKISGLPANEIFTITVLIM